MIYLVSLKVEELPADPKDLPKPSDTEVGDFYVRLGMAVAAWQFVEATLVHIFANAIGTLSYKALTAAFHVPNSFRGRLEMADAAIRYSDQLTTFVDEWDKLYNSTLKKSLRRNILTHSTVMFDPKRKAGDQLFLSPSVSDPTRFTLGFAPGTIVTKTELETMIDTFGRLQDDLHKFSLKLPPAIRPLPTSIGPGS